MRAKSRIWVQLSILAYVLILTAVAFLNVLPNLQEAESAKAQTVQVQQENSLHEQRLRQLEQEFLEVEDLQAELVELQKALPLLPEFAGFTGYIGEEARKAGLQVASLSMGDPRRFEPEAVFEQPIAEGTVIELPFSLSISGNVGQLYQFVKTLQYAEVLVTISSWQIDPNSSNLNLSGVRYVVSNSLEEIDPRKSQMLDQLPQYQKSLGGQTETSTDESDDGESAQ